MNNRLLISLFVLVLLTLSIHAQSLSDPNTAAGFKGKPNFSGFWRLNKELSTASEEFEDIGGAKLEIVDAEQKIKIVKTLWITNKAVTSEATYYLDGRRGKILKFRGGKRKAETTRSADGLISRYTLIKGTNTSNLFPTREGDNRSHFEQKVSEIWTMSADGQTLRITTYYDEPTIDLEDGELVVGPHMKERSREIRVFNKIN